MLTGGLGGVVLAGVRDADGFRGLRDAAEGFFPGPDLPDFDGEPPRDGFGPFWGPRLSADGLSGSDSTT
jgi:hypothetical protein